MIMPEEVEFRNEIPGGGVVRRHRELLSALTFRHSAWRKYDAVNSEGASLSRELASARNNAQTIL
jgi:hypothetical protein